MRPLLFFFFSSRRRHTRCLSDWSSDVCSSDLTRVTRADAPKVLEYKWGGFDMRWELEDLGGGTRLTLRSEEHTSELQSLRHLVCRLLLEKKKNAVSLVGDARLGPGHTMLPESH